MPRRKIITSTSVKESVTVKQEVFDLSQESDADSTPVKGNTKKRKITSFFRKIGMYARALVAITPKDDSGSQAGIYAVFQ